MKLPATIFKIKCPLGKRTWGCVRMYSDVPTDVPGSGVGKGGGGGGTVREAGGAFGKLPATIFKIKCPLGKRTWGCVRMYSDVPTDVPGSGVGKGGGGGGTVREAGGAFGKRGAAQEERFFYEKEKERLEKLRKEIAQKLKDLEKLKK